MILTLDVGTSSTRAYLYDASGHRMETRGAKVGHEPATTPDGGVEHDPMQLLEAAATCIDGALADATEVRAVAISTFWHGLLGFDAAGRPATPVYMWADTRSADAAAELQGELDGADVHRRTGCRLHSSYWPAKLRWLAAGGAKDVRRWGSIGEWLALNWFGEAATSVSMASATGLFDQDALYWDPEILEATELHTGALFPLRDVDDGWRKLRDPWARRWPRLRDATWLPAVGDGAASNLGSDCTTPDRIAINIGTSAAMRVVTGEPPPSTPTGLWRYRVDRRLSVVGGALSEGGNVYAWCREILRLPDEAQLENALAGAADDVADLTVLPFLAGERSLGWNGRARGAITGLSLDTTATEIAVAALRSIAQGLALVYGRLEPVASAGHEIVASGGALARSPAWAQLIADALGRPLILSAEREASSRGVGLLALRSLGLHAAFPTLDGPPGRRVEPNPDRHRRLRALLSRQRELYEALYPVASPSAPLGARSLGEGPGRRKRPN
jgi:gluconokinase